MPDPTGDRDNAIQPLEFFENFINQMATQHEREIVAKDDLITELRQDKQRLQTEADYLRLPWYRRIGKRSPE